METKAKAPGEMGGGLEEEQVPHKKSKKMVAKLYGLPPPGTLSRPATFTDTLEYCCNAIIIRSTAYHSLPLSN